MAEGAYNNENYDFMPAEFSDSGLDEVTIHLVMAQQVKGDWQTGYSVTWSGISDVIMSYHKGILISKKIIPLPDHTVEYTYNDEDKSIIKAALEYRQVKELIANNDILVSNIHRSVGFYDPAINCPIGHCVSVSITKAGTREALAVAVNTDTMQAVQTLFADGWSIS